MSTEIHLLSRDNEIQQLYQLRIQSHEQELRYIERHADRHHQTARQHHNR